MNKKLFIISFLFITSSYGFAEDIKESKSAVMNQINKLTMTIIEKHAELNNSKTRNVIAVATFENKSDAAKKENIGEAVSDVMQSELTKNKNLIIIEQEKVNKLLGEIEMSMTGMVDPKSAKVAGRMVAADMFLFGSVTELGNKFIINARMVEVETAQTLFAEKIEIDKKYLTSVAGAVLLEPKHPINAGLFSAIIPGWGQFYNNHNIKGGILLSAGIASIGSMVAFRYLAVDSQNKHDEATNKADALHYYDTAEQYHQFANYSFFAYAGIWVFGIVDAIISASSINSEIEQYKQALNYNNSPGFYFALDSANKTCGISLNYRF